MLISKLEEAQSSDEQVIERKLANTRQCLRDTFDVTSLQAEILQLEKKFQSGPRVNGRWKHLDLSRLPIAQANFLKNYGRSLGDLAAPDSIDYSSCEDVPCIYNKIYGKVDQTAGHVHYIWYLKFGSILSATNKIYNQSSPLPGSYNNKRHPLASYLYNEQELYALWRLSHLLKDSHSGLVDLKEIQRIPRNESIEGQNKETCGIAWSSGYVILSDGCLQLNKNVDSGHLYLAVTHELSHQIDFHEGRKLNRTYRSLGADYLDITNFRSTEFKNKDGQLELIWKPVAQAKLVSTYAASSPAESFAEDLTFYRLFARETQKKISPAHYQFIGKNYYRSHEFDLPGMFNLWLDDYLLSMNQDVAKAVVDCHEDLSDVRSNFFKLSDFSIQVLPSVVHCLGVKAQEISSKLQSWLMVKEPEACAVFTESKNDWQSAVKKRLIPAYDIHLREVAVDTNYLSRVQSFYAEIANKDLSRKAFFTCSGQVNEETCFMEDLRQLLWLRGSEIKLSDGQIRDFTDLYLTQNSFATTQSSIQSIYRNFAMANQEKIRVHGQDLWDSCLSLPPTDIESPRGQIFLLRQGYLISSIYNCLNSSLPTLIQEQVQNLSLEGIKVEHPKEQALLRQEVQKILVNHLTELYETEKSNEAKLAREFIKSDQGHLRLKLLVDFQWVKEIIDQKKFLNDCAHHGLSHIQYLLRFHLKKELFTEYLKQNSCLNLEETAEFKDWLEESKSSFSGKIKSDLQHRMLMLANQEAKQCLGIFPADNIISRLRFKKQREDCLLEKWERMENQLIEEILSDPMARKFQLSAAELKQQLENERRRMQIKVIRENFNLTYTLPGTGT